MKKLLRIVAVLKMGVSSLVIGSKLEVVDGGGYLVGVDRLSQQEIRLVRSGDFQYNPISGRFENDEVTLLDWNSDTATNQDFNLERLFTELCMPTTKIELVGNLSSGAESPVGTVFTKIQRIFDSLGTPHNLIFTFTRLPAGLDADNQIQYSTDITVEGGIVKRADEKGMIIDSFGASMIISFNQRGQLNLFDYGQPTESNVSPKLYVEWRDGRINSEPVRIDLNLGKGKGENPPVWTGENSPLAIANLTAYDANFVITNSGQDGGYAISRFLTLKEPLQFSWVQKATGFTDKFSKISQTNVRQTSTIELSGNLSSGGGTPVGECFIKTQRIFDSLGTPHNLIFKFIRLPAGENADNQIQYSTEIKVDGGVIKRMNEVGTTFDSLGSPMIITFNQREQLNLFDYGQPTESNTPPTLYVEWIESWSNSESFSIVLNLGKGKGENPTVWIGTPEPLAEGNLTAYDGNSLITHSKQDGLGYGRYERVRVSALGTISAHYTNGNSVDIGRLVFAIVPNPAGLKQVGFSYCITESSGVPKMALGGKVGWGILKATGVNSLESIQYTFSGTYPSSAVGAGVDELMESRQ